MPITATRRIQFAAGHRVFGHEGKCRHLHGHNFVAFVTAAAEDLDAVGRVIDFGVLKERIGGWIEREWDHGFVVWQDDAEARRALALVDGQKTYLLPANPTAENLADHLLRVGRAGGARRDGRPPRQGDAPRDRERDRRGDALTSARLHALCGGMRST